MNKDDYLLKHIKSCPNCARNYIGEKFAEALELESGPILCCSFEDNPYEKIFSPLFISTCAMLSSFLIILNSFANIMALPMVIGAENSIENLTATIVANSGPMTHINKIITVSICLRVL